MNEELEILTAASLADCDAPENIFSPRAKDFVHSKIQSDNVGGKTDARISPVHRGLLLWGSVSLAFAACVIAALMIFPSKVIHETGLGTQTDVYEMESIHAAMEIIPDSLKQEADTVLIKKVVTNE